MYVPRDECFSEVKQVTFNTKSLASVLHALVPALKTVLLDKNQGFPVFSEIDALFDEGLSLPPSKVKISNLLPRLVSFIKDKQEDLLRFDPPATMDSKIIIHYSLCLPSLNAIHYIFASHSNARGQILLVKGRRIWKTDSSWS